MSHEVIDFIVTTTSPYDVYSINAALNKCHPLSNATDESKTTDKCHPLINATPNQISRMWRLLEHNKKNVGTTW